MNKRLFQERLLQAVVFLSASAAFLLPLVLLAWIAYRGLGAVSWSFLTLPESDFGAAGGVLYQILGSVLLISGAAAVAAPLGWSLAILREVYLSGRALRRLLDLTLYALNGVPSIVFGLFGYLCFVHALGLGVSWTSGALILGLMILPTVTVAVAEGLAAMPRERREAAEALGLFPREIIRSTLWPASRPFLWTGVALGLARAAGETAPILFTAAVFSGVTLPHGFADPVVTLPTHVFTLAQEAADPVALANAWGAALVLVGLVGIFQGLSWLVRGKALKGAGYV